MLNIVTIQGRLGKDVDLKYSTGEKATAVGRFSIGCVSNYKSPNGTYDTDWINCVAFGKTAENIKKFFAKGDMILVNGRIKSGSYTNKDGNRVFTTDVVVNGFDFCGGKKESSANSATSAKTSDADVNGFMDIPEGADEELPFN